jgi:hypothetical protein
MKICACRPAGISGAVTTPQDQSPRQSGIAGPCFGMRLVQQTAAGFEERQFRHAHAGRTLNDLISSHEFFKQFDEAEGWRRKWHREAEAGERIFRLYATWGRPDMAAEWQSTPASPAEAESKP